LASRTAMLLASHSSGKPLASHTAAVALVAFQPVL